MIKMKKTILFLTLSIASLFSFSQIADKGDKKSQEILEQLSIKTQSFENFVAHFDYTMENKEAGIDEKTSGVLKVKGDQYNLLIAGQEVISNGETIWTYIEDAEEVQINEAEEDETITPTSLLANYNEDFRSKFINEAFLYGTTAYVIDLTPIEGKHYYKIRLILDKSKMELLDFTIFDKNGSTYSYIIKKFETNVDLPESIFSFDPSQYPGVDVIDMR